MRTGSIHSAHEFFIRKTQRTIFFRFEPAEQPASRDSPTPTNEQAPGQSSPRKGQPKARRNLGAAYGDSNAVKKQVPHIIK